MTSKKTETEELADCKDALRLIIKAATGMETDPPPEVLDDPLGIASVAVSRMKTMAGAEESTAGLMELAAELAARGDRWKKLAGRAFDTLCKKPNENWQKAAELGEGILGDVDWGPFPNELGNPEGGEDARLQDFEYSIMAARETMETPEEVRITFKNRYAKECKNVSSEQMAERVQVAFQKAMSHAEKVDMVREKAAKEDAQAEERPPGV